MKKELKIKNWVYFNEIPHQIEELGTCSVKLSNLEEAVSYEDIQPIEITRDWLSDVFKIEKKGGFYDIEQMSFMLTQLTHQGFLLLDSDDPLELIFIKKPIKYVHNFQNLIFSLFEKEL